MQILPSLKQKLTARAITLTFVWLFVALGMMIYYKSPRIISGDLEWTSMFALFSLDAVFGYIVATILVFGCEIAGRVTENALSDKVTTMQLAALRYIASAVFGISGVFAASYGWFTLLFGYPTSTNFLIDLVVLSLTIPLFVNGLMETFHYHGAWQSERLEKEAASREALLAEFEALKNQVSPHFLFNSFATLSHIIQEDPARASVFVDDLADVFRYVLQNRDTETVALSEELKAVQSLLQVHAVRVPGGLNTEINISEKVKSEQILPMALYTLVENALKHNVVTVDQPLLIKIYIDKNQSLVVENTLQPRRTRDSLGTGLKNLDRRFQLILRRGIDIEKADGKFIVRAPLIGTTV